MDTKYDYINGIRECLRDCVDLGIQVNFYGHSPEDEMMGAPSIGHRYKNVAIDLRKPYSDMYMALRDTIQIYKSRQVTEEAKQIEEYYRSLMREHGM